MLSDQLNTQLNSGEANSPIPRRRIAFFLILMLVGVVADLGTKDWVFSRDDMFYGSEWWFWQNHIGIQKSLNEGALFGMGQGKVWLFAAFSIAALISIPIWLFLFRAAEDYILTYTLGGISAGILGNLYDRLGLHGLNWNQFNSVRGDERVFAVRDWILCQWNPQWVWPNFNLADAYLVLGAGILMFHSIMLSKTS